jgi:hypothetical protein
MKSTKLSPFDWATNKATLFTKTEKLSMNNLAVVKTLERKTLNFYSKAKLNAK